MITLTPSEELQWYEDIFYQQVATEDQIDIINQQIKTVSHLFESGTVFSSKSGNVVDEEVKITNEVVLDDHMNNTDVVTLYKSLEKPVIEFVSNIIDSKHISASYLKDMHLKNGRFRIKHYVANEGKYDWHLDMGGEWGNRILTVLLYLNNVSEGGETEFSNQECKIPCVRGSLCAFPPYWNFPHRSVENLSDDKTILALFVESI